MKKYIYTLFAAAAALAAFSACNKQEAPVTLGATRTVTITAALENAVSKATTGSEVGKFAWESGDVIGVWVGDAFVPFTLDASAAGATAGKFTGQVPEGKELGFAVYPYSERDTYADNIYTSGYNESWWEFHPTLHMYAPKAGTANEYKFQHLCAYAMITIKNVREDCKYIYLESPGGPMFLTGGQHADLSAEYPKFTDGVQEQGFVPLPEDHSKIVIYAPILPGPWADNKLFKVKFFQKNDWSYEYGKNALAEEPVINHIGKLQTGGIVNRGELIVFPEIVFEGGEASGISATIEGGMSWLSGTKIGIWNGTALTEMTVAGGNVAVGEFEGNVPDGAMGAITPTTGVTIDGNTLTVERGSWGDYTTGAVLWGKIGEPTSSAYKASIAFKHLGATVRATLNNVPAAAKYCFIETGPNSKFIYTKATADLSAAEPVLSNGDVTDWAFAPLPAHADGAKIVVDFPILPGEYTDANPMFNIELYEETDWGKKIADSKKNMNLTETAGKIARGGVYELTYNW